MLPGINRSQAKIVKIAWTIRLNIFDVQSGGRGNDKNNLKLCGLQVALWENRGCSSETVVTIKLFYSAKQVDKLRIAWTSQ